MQSLVRLFELTIKNRYKLLLSSIFVISLLVRLNNLNYNSPHNDEAAYVIVGRMGIFQWDWWTYNSSNWLGGSVFFYPVLSGLSYMMGGIVGSRLLNVVFSILAIDAVIMLTMYLSGLKGGLKYMSGAVAAVIVSFTPISYFISRFATYDMPSFFFLFISLVFLLIAERSSHNVGKFYFISAILLITSFLTKYIIAIYIPLIFIYSFIQSSQKGNRQKFYWKRYFLAPILIVLGIYFTANLETFFQFSKLQNSKIKENLYAIFRMLWFDDPYVWGLYIIGSFGLFLRKQFKLWFALSLCAVWIVVPHLLSQRALLTLEKQVFLTSAFLAPLVGIGIANIIGAIRLRQVQVVYIIYIVALLTGYSSISYFHAQRFNREWSNATPMLNELSQVVKKNDKVLAEVGAAGILATYDHNYPPNTATFDWFEHRGKSGKEAYVEAIQEGYFNVVELEDDKYHEEAGQRETNHAILASLPQNYKLVFSQKGYYIYTRTF